MAALINQSILPQLSNHLRTVFVLNPQNQNILPMMQLLEWKDHIPLHLFSHLFETDFFPKFHQCLWTWLSSSHANLVEITQWYTSWKNLFESQGLERLDAFKQGFRTALDMMNQGTSAAMPSRFVPSKPKQQQTFTEESAFGDMSFKDYVELLCSESNLEFVPTTKRHSSGKDLYRLGKLQVYIEDGVLFVQDGKNGYTYSSIEDAIQKALSLQ
jgi:tuftelin-interacting protein 11